MTRSRGASLFAPESCQRCARTNERTSQTGRRAPKGAGVEPRARQQALPPVSRSSRRAFLLGNALASRRSTAALADCSAQSGPALHGSANGCDSVRHPGSQLLADWRRGQPGEFPNRLRAECMAPPAGTALAPSRGVPSAERPLTDGERGGSLVAYSATKSTKKLQCLRAELQNNIVGLECKVVSSSLTALGLRQRFAYENVASSRDRFMRRPSCRHGVWVRCGCRAGGQEAGSVWARACRVRSASRHLHIGTAKLGWIKIKSR